MRCLILAAGYATRLWPLTKDRPKALLPIKGTPILEIITQEVLKLKGLDKVYIVSNHKFYAHICRWLADFIERKHPHIPIEIVDDMSTSNENRLGAIGDILFVMENCKIDNDLLVIAGDNLFKFSLQEFVDYAIKRGTAVALYKLESLQEAVKYGTADLDQNNRVIYFEEKSGTPRSDLISAGIYYFANKHLPLIKQYLSEGHNKDMPGFLLQWLYSRIELWGYIIKGTWFDIGDISCYNRANEIWQLTE